MVASEQGYLQRFRQPGKFTAFVLSLETMALTRVVVAADDADQAAAIARARLHDADLAIPRFEIVMTVPGIVGSQAGGKTHI